MSKVATASGVLVDVINTDLETLHIDDIAHHLSKESRYANATPLCYTYSVAEHCINLANHCIESGLRCFAMYALLHDASEYLLKDIPSPIKKLLPDYKKLESNFQKCILKRFDVKLCKSKRDYISSLDKRVLIDEVSAIMPEKLILYPDNLDPLGCDVIFNLSPRVVKGKFLKLFKDLRK